ncbi:MAG: ATP-dependent helicase, partial [Dactylosporangium sp.]|nr:ATP-dependent helicase [Dactylosporangium sp.]NNJ62533.1 ATP-dependent helicase [Dactylosporangium sp.]
MLVVHGLWLRGGHLALWAEDAALPAELPKRRGRPPRQRPHPFAADAAKLAEALGDLAKPATPGTLILELPTLGTGPAASPELGRVEDPPKRGAALGLARWSVATLDHDADEALEVLLGYRRGEVGLDRDDLVCGATLRHLGAVAAFATDLVARGRVLPTVDDGPDGPRALWKPLLTGGDVAWARDLALA